MPALGANKALPQLDDRLLAAAAYVRPGSVCADIGCDHGKLSLYLAAHGVCRRVIACDIREKPLAQAARNLARHGCAALVECRLGDGLSVLAPDEVSDIVIAGVSGVTASEILRRAPAFHTARHRFIFVPASKGEVLRAWLFAHGFALLGETPARAAGRCYTVICAQYTGVRHTPTPLECWVGRAAQVRTPAAAGYLHRVAGQLRRQGAQALARQIEEETEQWGKD